MLLGAVAVVAVSAAPSQAVLRVREWRAAYERVILAELIRLVPLPNIASNPNDHREETDLLTSMFETTIGTPTKLARRPLVGETGAVTGGVAQVRCWSLTEKAQLSSRRCPPLLLRRSVEHGSSAE